MMRFTIDPATALVVRAGKEPKPFQTYFENDYTSDRDLLLADFKHAYISAALSRNNYNIPKTAKEIGIDRSKIHRILNTLPD